MSSQKFNALLAARDHDPFATLGVHQEGHTWFLHLFRPHAQAISVQMADGSWAPLLRLDNGLFEWRGIFHPPIPCKLRVDGVEGYDAYSFPPQPPKDDLHLFNTGRLQQGWRHFGAVVEERNSVCGVCFRVWAPNARRVSVIGDFNRWDGRVHPLQSLGNSGVWELFIPELSVGALYRFEILTRLNDTIVVKTDPYARELEFRPATACRVTAPPAHVWRDDAWLKQRASWDWMHAPMSIYELHAGSWMRHPDNRFYSYREIAERLVPYVKEMGYTHVEFLPLTEHPLDESWGYQCTGFFAPTARFGSADELRHLIDALHQAGIGVILDWVPGHFPSDDWALSHFDGSALYEMEDPKMKVHPDWGTHVFDFGRTEVKSFLLSSAHYWLSQFHIDGLRVDAVASMLQLDYSRPTGQWTPNEHGGRENLHAINFVKELNTMVHAEFPGALTIAEESTAWPMVSRPIYIGGLGFSMKWNMGWMNDTLAYFKLDPVFRRFNHQRLTFGQMYAYTENFVLPLSHDEVVHGKSPLVGKMPGDEWQRFANLRLLLAYQMALPGKKLQFMGAEIGQNWEWRATEELPWHLLQYPLHSGVQRLVIDLNRLYVSETALHELDFAPEGYQWIDFSDVDQSVIAWLRFARKQADDVEGRVVRHAVVVCNFTPVPRYGYRIGVPQGGIYQERINTDSDWYGGSNLLSGPSYDGLRHTEAVSWMGRAASLVLDLPPLAVLILTPADD